MLLRAVLVMIGVLVLALGIQSARLDRAQGQLLEAEASAAHWERELRTAERVAEQARLARSVADAEAARQRAVASEYEAVKAALRRGGWDAPLPDDFRALLVGLLRAGGPR